MQPLRCKELGSNNDENNPWPPPPRQEIAATKPLRRRTVNFGCLGLLFAAGSVAVILVGYYISTAVWNEHLPVIVIERQTFWITIVRLVLAGLFAASGLVLSLRERSKALAIAAAVACGIIVLLCLFGLCDAVLNFI